MFANGFAPIGALLLLCLSGFASATGGNAVCAEYKRPCDNGMCVEEFRFCDDHNDCTDGSDERHCDRFYCDKKTHFFCETSSQCIEGKLVCSGNAECTHGEDEDKCEKECKVDEYRCSSGRCIEKSWVCDGHVDCSDYSDEQQCQDSSSGCGKYLYHCKNASCISMQYFCDGGKDCPLGDDEANCGDIKDCAIQRGFFHCATGKQCIHSNLVCDKEKHCVDGSDEGGKCEMKCKLGYCSHKCTETPNGPQCICKEGYYLGANEKSCLDMDECAGEVMVCDHFCSNTDGSFNCTCGEGFKLMSDGKTCRSSGALQVSLATGSYVISSHVSLDAMIDLETKYRITGFTYDPVGGTLYWIEGNKIYSRSLLKRHAQPDLFISEGLQNPHHIDVDPYSRNLYVTDTDKNHILVCSIIRAVCIPLINSSCLDIKVDGLNSLLFWTEDDALMVAKLDGSGQRKLVVPVWPLAFAIDPAARRIFYVDKSLNRVVSVNYNVKQRKMLPEHEIDQPTLMVIGEDMLYWSDLDKSDLKACRKRDGKKYELHYRSRKGSISDVRLIAKLHPKDGICSNVGEPGSCSHICVPSTNSGFVCYCPDEMVLANDGKTCVDKSKSYLLLSMNSTLLSLQRVEYGNNIMDVHLQASHPFKSISGLDYNPVAGKIYVSDMGNNRIFVLNEDSKKVSFTMEVTAPMCVRVDWLRNNLYWINAHYHSIEMSSTSGHYKRMIKRYFTIPVDIQIDVEDGFIFIADGSLVSSIQRCDLMIQQCEEIAEHVPTPQSLFLDMYVKPGRLYWLDEEGRMLSTYKDGNEMAIVMDKLISPMELTVTPDDIYWISENSNHLYSLSKRKSAFKSEYIETAYTEGLYLNSLTFINKHFQRIPLSFCKNNMSCHHLCFSTNETTRICGCEDGMDLSEDGSTCNIPHCNKGQFKCTSGQCIADIYRCDFEKHCEDGSDESGCSSLRNCTSEEFTCGDGRCISASSTCDEFEDCLDGSDEMLPRCQKLPCPHSDLDWKCINGGCIPLVYRCNQKKDCKDGSDEIGCRNTTCPSNWKRCQTGMCVAKSWVCDGALDCPNGEDEQNCPCTNGFKCDNGICHSKSVLCNSIKDCTDGTDEKTENCPTLTCPENKIQCSSDGVSQEVSCISESQWCNGVKDCPSGEDEVDCEAECRPPKKSCRNGEACILSTWICDGELDCKDGSDEEGCTSKAPATTSPPEVSHCRSGEFRCINGHCVSLDKVCNGAADCHHGEDEHDCDICERFNGGCSHFCHITPLGARCSCPQGFMLDSDGFSCKDVDECSQDVCDHTCHNHIGGYVCSCMDGYFISGDGVTCKPEDGEKSELLILEDKIIRTSAELEVLSETLLDVNVREVKKFSYDPVYQKYLLLIGNKLVMGEGDTWATLLTLHQPLDFSRDFVNHLTYIIEKKAMQYEIIACSKEKLCASLYRSGKELSSVVVASFQKRLFFCENGNTGSVSVSRLDGTDLKELAGQKILKCSCLAVDDIRERIYWVDYLKQSIESVDITGRNRKVFSRNSVHNPVGMVLLDRRVVWYNHGNKELKSCEMKSTKCNAVHVEQTPLLGIKRHSRTPSDSWPCSNSVCDQICLPHSATVSTCLCSDGYTLVNKSNCVIDADGYLGAFQGSCSVNPCLSGKCIQLYGEYVYCLCPTGTTGKRCQTEGGQSWVPALVLVFFGLAVSVAAYYLYRKYPDKFKFRKSTLSEGFQFVNPAYGLKADDRGPETHSSPTMTRFMVPKLDSPDRLSEGTHATVIHM